jgi:predicted AAA+ superfamily ATPase
LSVIQAQTACSTTAVKRAINKKRALGRFLLTGSANLLLIRQVSELLGGQATSPYGQ